MLTNGHYGWFMERRGRLSWVKIKGYWLRFKIWKLWIECSERTGIWTWSMLKAYRTKKKEGCDNRRTLFYWREWESWCFDREVGADVDGDVMTVAKTLTMKQLRKDIFASIEHAAYFHVSMEEWICRAEIEPQQKKCDNLHWQSVRAGIAGRTM